MHPGAAVVPEFHKSRRSSVKNAWYVASLRKEEETTSDLSPPSCWAMNWTNFVLRLPAAPEWHVSRNVRMVDPVGAVSNQVSNSDPTSIEVKRRFPSESLSLVSSVFDVMSSTSLSRNPL